MHTRHLTQPETEGAGVVLDERQLARRRIQARRDFFSHLATYIVVNGFLVGVWALSGEGYFWPAWVIGAWGIGLVMHAWDMLYRRAITEADIERELRRHGPRQTE